ATRRRGVPGRVTPLAAPGFLGRVRRAPRLPAWRRPALRRLAHVRAFGPALREAVRRGDEPAGVPAGGRECVDGVVVGAGRAADEALVREAAHGEPVAAPAPPGRCRGADRIRRADPDAPAPPGWAPALERRASRPRAAGGDGAHGGGGRASGHRGSASASWAGGPLLGPAGRPGVDATRAAFPAAPRPRGAGLPRARPVRA